MKDQRDEAARKFAEEWKGRGYEKGQTQPFWLALLHRVYGIENPERYIRFEAQVKIDTTSFIDGYIADTKVMIEQKSIEKSLNQAIRQADGTLLTPFQQAKRYIGGLPLSEHPRWLITCNFAEFWVYDMEQPNNEPEKILLKDLEKEYYRLEFLVDKGNHHLQKEMDVSVKAGELVGEIYDAFSKQFRKPMSEEDMSSLNILCVRLVFCLYAENAGLFGRYGLFHDYMDAIPTSYLRQALINLFEVLNTPEGSRNEFLINDNEHLDDFPYVNGGLFKEKDIKIPSFTSEIRDILLNKASAGFNWSDISPTIFGAVFESTLNPETRRAGGMHYTSIENINKVIDPLFLDDLKAEFANICATVKGGRRRTALRAFQAKLASLTFLDPACGSGNFLTESYISLRRLENSVLRELSSDGQILIGGEFSPIQVNLSQFYGIEINDFAVSVAKTALWIAEHQMMKETETIVGTDLNFLPLKSYTNIVERNALRMDWESVVPKDKLNYIMGNPPFVGARLMGEEQKKELNAIFQNWKNVGNLDYVCCWYKKATDLMKGTNIRTALVSTNSITQGEHVANLWKPLMEDVHIDFACRSFKWNSEASQKAQVHCVIVGFSVAPNNKAKVIYYGDRKQVVKNINGYLVDAPNTFIDSRTKPLCNVPEIGIGNKPIDDGNYLFTAEERDEFIKKEPKAEKYFRPWYGATEFVNSKPRYCLWLGDCSPSELRSMPECLKRVEAVRQFRLASKSAGTVKLADKPTRFHVENMPKGNFIIVSKVSSDNRRYIAMGFMPPNVFCSDLVFIIPNSSLYHFGILTSNVHNGWMRAVCGRLGMAYRYSKDIVYNNFPWPNPTDEQKARIEETAQAILDARAECPEASLADLYNETLMPLKLRKAHQDNDQAVMAAYGWGKNHPAYTSESTFVAELMKMYKELKEK